MKKTYYTWESASIAGTGLLCTHLFYLGYLATEIEAGTSIRSSVAESSIENSFKKKITGVRSQDTLQK